MNHDYIIFITELYIISKASGLSKGHDVHLKNTHMTKSLSKQELTSIGLFLTENGTDDIISTRSKFSQKLMLMLKTSLSISALIRLIEENPSLWRVTNYFRW